MAFYWNIHAPTLAETISVCSARKACSNLSRCEHCFTVNIRRRKFHWLCEFKEKGGGHGLLQNRHQFICLGNWKSFEGFDSILDCRSSCWNTISACCSHFSGWLLFYVFSNKAICNQYIVAVFFSALCCALFQARTNVVSHHHLDANINWNICRIRAWSSKLTLASMLTTWSWFVSCEFITFIRWNYSNKGKSRWKLNNLLQNLFYSTFKLFKDYLQVYIIKSYQ